MYCIILATGECLPLLRNQRSCSDRIHSEVVLLSDNDHLYNSSCKEQRRITWGAVTLLPSIEGQKHISNIHVSGKHYYSITIDFESSSIASGTIKLTQLGAIKHSEKLLLTRTKVYG